MKTKKWFYVPLSCNGALHSQGLHGSYILDIVGAIPLFINFLMEVQGYKVHSSELEVQGTWFGKFREPGFESAG